MKNINIRLLPKMFLDNLMMENMNFTNMSLWTLFAFLAFGNQMTNAMEKEKPSKFIVEEDSARRLTSPAMLKIYIGTLEKLSKNEDKNLFLKAALPKPIIDFGNQPPALPILEAILEDYSFRRANCFNGWFLNVLQKSTDGTIIKSCGDIFFQEAQTYLDQYGIR